MQQAKYSGLDCLQMLVENLRRNINFDAVMTGELKARYLDAPADVLLEIADNLQLKPELVTDLAADFSNYAGPALLPLQNGNWICLLKLSQLAGSKVDLFDPLMNTATNTISVPKDQLLGKAAGQAILFRNLNAVDHSRQTALFCLVNLARHHHMSLDVGRLMHRYAIGETEPGLPLLLEIAIDCNFKCRHTVLSWQKLQHMGNAYPFIGIDRNHKYVIFCGIRQNEGVPELVVSDPGSGNGQVFQFLSQAEYEERFSGEVVLVKKVFTLGGEHPKFGLLWFLPEFIRLSEVFRHLIVTVVMITLIALIMPIFFQVVVDRVLVNKAYQTLNVLGIGMVIAVLFNAGLEFLRNYYLLFATNRIDMATASKTFRHLMRLPVGFFERNPSGMLVKHMQQTEKIRGFLSGNLFFTFLDVLSLVIFLPFLLFYSVELTLVVIGFSAMMALVIAVLIKPFQSRLNELYRAEGKRQSMLVESIHGIRTVKTLALEPLQTKHWNDTSAYAIQSYFKVGKISMSAKSISQILEMLMTVTVIWLGTMLVLHNALSVGSLIAFQMLSMRVSGPLVRMVGLVHEYQQIAVSVNMLGHVMNTPAEEDKGGVTNPLRGAVSFENVTFQYTLDTPQVIRNFSLDIPVGSMIGIVGRSGSGKTTLTKLLQNLYPLNSGLIKIDGIDLREINKAHLRSSIGVVLQENYFFTGTIRENIALTKRNATLDEVVYAAKLAGADEFVSRLPQAYDTVLEENGGNLSGGQKQRLAIARALLTNPAILIFDEATSALDPESESVVQDNLNMIAKGRTVLIVSHRLSIVSGASKILVIDKGEKVDFASHRELLAKDGIYRDFWMQQMERNLKK